MENPAPGNVIYEFSEIPHWSRYFAQITPYRELIREELATHVSRKRKIEAGKVPPPVICLQVRLGDFRALQESEKFAEVGLVRTPISYFLDFITQLRAIAGQDLPVTVVSDGSALELAPLLALPGVSHTPGLSAIADLLIMSSAKLLVTAAGSTFGQWAGFLGDSILLHHPEHFHFLCRGGPTADCPFEGAHWPNEPDSWPSQLIDSIKGLMDHVGPV